MMREGGWQGYMAKSAGNYGKAHHSLWRAVDQDDNVLDILVQSRRNKQAAKTFFRPQALQACRDRRSQPDRAPASDDDIGLVPPIPVGHAAPCGACAAAGFMAEPRYRIPVDRIRRKRQPCQGDHQTGSMPWIAPGWRP